MALIDDLISRVSQRELRSELSNAIEDMRRSQRFGLVYENHVPETVALPGLPLSIGMLVRPKIELHKDTIYRVTAIGENDVTIRPVSGGDSKSLPMDAIWAIKRFGDPIYPALAPLDVVQRGPVNKPHHAVIDGENFHVLQLLVYLFEGAVDCIYIDPPYNSGAKDWKYNNRYVDDNDAWRHSKWLSFMQKRLALAKRLLKPDGVLVVTIDKNEHYHLGVLLEQEFKKHDLTSVCIVHNPRGIQGDNFSYTNEFGVFVTPAKQKVIADRLIPIEERDTRDLRDNGGESLRTNARNCFYPILVSGDQVVGFGDVPSDDFHPVSSAIPRDDGVIEVWPLDRSSIERKWRYARQSVHRIQQLLSVEYTRATRSVPSVPQIKLTKETGKHRTVWSGSRYDANINGTRLVKKLTGVEFPFPKSVLAVRDTLYACVKNKPDALILDFFAGSGTTLHATCMLNSEDAGSRRCVLVTNNEVAEKQAIALRRDGLYPGDPEYDKHGIFEAVTVPRCKAAVTGEDRSGKKIEGDLDGRAIATGYDENVEFFRLVYLDPDEVDLGLQFEAILPALWLSAGGLGNRRTGAIDGIHIPSDAAYAILLDERQFRRFLPIVFSRPDLKRAWLVTDSEEAFAEMRSRLPRHLEVSMLYRDYLRTFLINTRLML